MDHGVHPQLPGSSSARRAYRPRRQEIQWFMEPLVQIVHHPDRTHQALRDNIICASAKIIDYIKLMLINKGNEKLAY